MEELKIGVSPAMPAQASCRFAGMRPLSFMSRSTGSQAMRATSAIFAIF
jgi:hypothetical protein